ncbi:MAG: hypothetical protein WAV38_33520 [Xanthobacteraceae bacterium]
MSTIDPAWELYWVRDGDGWVLKLGKRKLGRVFPDAKHPNMWRSKRADGRPSDMANLSWAKAAVLAVAERDLAPPKTQHIGALLPAKPSPVEAIEPAVRKVGRRV